MNEEGKDVLGRVLVPGDYVAVGAREGNGGKLIIRKVLKVEGNSVWIAAGDALPPARGRESDCRRMLRINEEINN